MIKIVEENKFFIVINKPEGVSVHNEKPSLVEFLQAKKLPLHFVSRLDRETSGLMIVARTPGLHEELAESLTTGEKTYRALLRGPWKTNKTAEQTTVWKWALSDKAEGRQNPQGVSSDRIPCESQVKLVRTNTYFTEVLVTLLSGRQHQIRKHAALSKQAIVGDKRYNEKKYNASIAERYKQDRLWLHAEKLQFKFQNKEYAYESKFNLGAFFT